MATTNNRDTFQVRDLKADEISVRQGQGGMYLLYKDARVDMDVLDDMFTPYGWQREHREVKGVMYCGVSIKHGDEWITKWDAGDESNIEKEKGEASDSFKRACTNWGIGRELYTAPKISIPGKHYGLHVSDITIENKKITRLEIKNNREVVVFLFENGRVVSQPAAPAAAAPTPPPAPAAPAEPLGNILEAVRKAPTIQDLTVIYNQHKKIFEADANAKAELTKRRREIEAQQTQTQQ